MLNPFFQQGSKSEQNLLQDLINEQLRMYGVEVHYLPRKYATESSVLREVIQSVFDDAYPIEAYVDNYEGYDDNTTILSKFGIQTTQEINLIISKERWETYVSPLIKNESNIKLSTRPKEGDLIYFPLGDKLFEIKFVEYQKPFYQLQKNYVYELRCEIFRIGDEVIDTGVGEIDDVLVAGESDGLSEDGVSTVVAGSQTLTLVGTSSTATAITNVVNGGIRSISISNQGAYYPLAPTVAISSAPSSGITGIATVILDRTALKAVHLTNAGAGYTVAPEVSFITTNGIGGTAQSLIGDGAIGIITVTSGGAGYTTTPSVTFAGVSTVSAAATAILNSSGEIIAINITNSGFGYTQAPTITIADPPSTGTGDFLFNEVITGSTSGATARVRSWNSSTNSLQIANVTGTFAIGEALVGADSGASHTLRLVNLDPVSDGFTDNTNIELEADGILDFTETNPFGLP